MKNFLISYATAHNSFNLVNIEAKSEVEALKTVNQWREVVSAQIEEQ